MKTTFKGFKINCTIILFGCLLAACGKTDIAPGAAQEAYVNFYNASEVLLQGKLTKDNMVYVNDSISNEHFRNFPQFSNAPSLAGFREYPIAVTVGPSSIAGNNQIAIPPGIGYNPVFWLPVLGGDYRFIYTSVNKVYLQDTTLSLSPQSFVMQYLVESKEADDAYRIISVPVEHKPAEGKVRIQVVNLSPDIDELEVVRVDRNGNLVQESLPSSLAFGAYSTYADIDTAGSSHTGGQLILRFRKTGSTETLVPVGVPANPSSVFSLVFQGFETETVRRIKTKNDEYQQVKVTPNLRVNKRRTF